MMIHSHISEVHTPREKKAHQPSLMTEGKETILVVEDEKSISTLIEKFLKHQGYTVLLAYDGNSGIDIFSKNAHMIDLVVLDLTLPGILGKTVFEKMLAIKPDVAVIVMSGYYSEEIRSGILSRAKEFVAKPFSMLTLEAYIRSVLDKAEQSV
ncbi:response regulator [bacterium]|nr:response regulator [bacterium]